MHDLKDVRRDAELEEDDRMRISDSKRRVQNDRRCAIVKDGRLMNGMDFCFIARERSKLSLSTKEVEFCEEILMERLGIYREQIHICRAYRKGKQTGKMLMNKRRIEWLATAVNPYSDLNYGVELRRVIDHLLALVTDAG